MKELKYLKLHWSEPIVDIATSHIKQLITDSYKTDYVVQLLRVDH